MPSLLEALERKYCSDHDDCPLGNANDSSAAEQERIISIFIPRLSPLLSVPELLVLNDCDIDCAGDFESIREKCQRVRELDLAQNKLRDWQEVFHILKHMPRIEFLNLSKNHLSGPIGPPKLCAPSICNLRSIVLNGTYLDWACVHELLEQLSVLEELHLSLNNYREVLIDTAGETDGLVAGYEQCNANNCCQQPLESQNYCDSRKDSDKYKQVAKHHALKTLHFTGNPIENWQEICRLGRIFPNLQNLVLADCPIKSIYLNDQSNNGATNETTKSNETEFPYQYFLNLLFLNLSYASLNTWDDIDQLARFPKLRNLRVTNWPLWDRLECTEHERRQLLIARLPNIQLLNGGGKISDDEREDAERAFIRHYMDKPEWERPRRYDELIAKHGKLDPLVNINLKPDKHVKVFLTFKDRQESRLVDIYRTVSDLKVKLEKFVGIPPNKMRLYYLDKDYKEFGPEEMKYPNKLLYSYNIQTGDEIIIDEKK